MVFKKPHNTFNKDVSQLNLGEAAFLAGCINAPDTYNPLNNLNEANTKLDHLKAAQNRRNVTLELMLLEYVERTSDDPNQAYITQTLSEVMELTGQDPAIIPMDIYTALNQDAQKQADEICNGNIVQFPNEYFDVGFSMIENDTGEIIAVGPGRRYHSDSVKIDYSTEPNQPGSSMKPLLAYASTFDILGWSTAHQVNDKKKDYWKNGSYAPKNSDGKYNGIMSLQDALGVSKNTTAAQAMIDLVTAKGYDYWIDYCKKLGFSDEVAEGFNEQYAIGGSSMRASPIQQASAYSTFANGGKRVDAHRVRKVVRRSDKKEFKTNAKTYDVISEQAAWMISQLLEKVVSGGYQNYNEILASNYTVYGKSGTTDWPANSYGIPEGVAKDEWSVGYTNKYTIACWSGYTTDAITNYGLYITWDDLNVASAFHISHYMLDYMQKYATYSALERPSGISDYKGGYIKDEFKSKGDTTSDNKVIQHLITMMRKMLVKLVVANGMKKTRHVKSLIIKKEKLVKPMVVNGILKLVHVKKKKKKKKQTKPKKLVQITAELGTEVHVHILLQNQQNQQNQQNLQHLNQRSLVLQEQILPQTTQQAMFGLIEEISTIYSIDYNNESAQLSTFFVHKKTGIIFLFQVLYSQFEVVSQLADQFLLKDILSQVLSIYKPLEYGMVILLFFLHFLIE